MGKRRITFSLARPGPIAAILIATALSALRYGEVVDWSWAWVTAPVWVPLGFILFATALLRLFPQLREFAEQEE